MRRSLAPSQVLKRKSSPWEDEDDESDDGVKRRSHKFKKSEGESKALTSFPQHLARQPFTSLCLNSSAKPTEHEARIKSILSKPFKVPIPNYQGKQKPGNFSEITLQLCS